MSLIFSSRVNQATPVVVSDLAISNSAEVDQRVAVLPSVGPITNFFDGDGWTITALQQKMAVIADTVVLAWAGSPIGGAIAVDHLREVARTELLTSNYVNAYLRDCPDVEVQAAQFVGWKAEESGGFTALCCRNDEAVYGGTSTYIGGSGSSVLRPILKMRKGWGGMQARDPVSPAAAACELAMPVVGHLLRSEHADGYPLLHFFGGGYEIAYYDGTRFRKRGNLSYAVWDAKVWLGFGKKPTCSFSHPMMLVTQQYHEDWLLLKAYRFPEGRVREIQSNDSMFVAIKPPGVGISTPKAMPTRAEVPDIGARICNVFRVRFGSNAGYYAAIQGSALPGLVIRRDHDSVWVSVDQRFVDAVGTTMAEGASGVSGFSGRIPVTARTESLAPFLVRD